MPRPPSLKVRVVQEKLLARLDDGLHRPGDRFLSARAIAAQFDVSYQTADRLLRQMVIEGRLVRRGGSGSYVPGKSARAFCGVQLLFDRRARRVGSFGARLREELLVRFRDSGVDVRTTWVDSKLADVSSDRYPILWESPHIVARLASTRQRGLILNHRPPPGLGALQLDSIEVDDLLGGAIAAEMLARRISRGSRVAVLAGPKDDPRSGRRVEGFLSILPGARVTHAPNWFRDDARSKALRLLETRPAAVFACNDRLAQAILDAATVLGMSTPMLFGFDDAPIAEQLHLSTIAIPWSAMADAAVSVATRRLSNDEMTAAHLILRPRPIVRLT